MSAVSYYNYLIIIILAYPQHPAALPLGLLDKSTILGENYVPLLAEALLESLF